VKVNVFGNEERRPVRSAAGMGQAARKEWTMSCDVTVRAKKFLKKSSAVVEMTVWPQ